MTVFISGCTVSNLTSPLTDCVDLGGRGPNGSMGPNDPNKEKTCCNGLSLRSPKWCTSETDSPGKCQFSDGCGTVCIACGNSNCDAKYENKCNCPEDCK